MASAILRSTVVAVVCGVGAAGAAGAASVASLQGAYAVSANSACLLSALPFDADSQPTNPNLAFPASRSLSGTFTFDGTGLGRAVFKSLTVASAPTAATQAEADTARLRYRVTGGAVVITLENVRARYLTGPEAGHAAVVDRIEFTGGVAADGTSLTLAGAEPNAETTTIDDGSVIFSLCATAGSLVKM